MHRIYNVYVTVRKSLREKMNKFFAPIRCRKLSNTDFSIISNNCWGAHVYRYYGLPYSSPTIGLYIWADDYIRMLKHLKEYFSAELEFINFEDSRHRDELINKQQQKHILARLVYNDEPVEIVFLHYKSQEEAAEKWKRRVKRVNFNNIIVKNAYQNGCNEELLQEFDKLQYKKKIMFVHKKSLVGENRVLYRGYENDEVVRDDTFKFRKYVNLYRLINS